MNFSEGRPFCFVPLPTFCHEITHFTRASAWRREEKAGSTISPHIGQVGQHFGITLTFIRLLSSKSQDLPECDPKRPDVTFGGEFALQTWNKIVHLVAKTLYKMSYQKHGLPSHPANREKASWFCLVVIILVHGAAHSKVTDFDGFSGSHDTISATTTPLT